MAEPKQKSGDSEPAPTHDDLAAAQATLQTLLAASEADHAKVVRSQAKRQRAELRLRQQGLTAEEIDPEDLPALYPGDPAVHKALHAHAYTIARIEKAMGINQPPVKDK